MNAYPASPCLMTRLLAVLDQVPLNCSGLLVADGDEDEDDDEPVETPEPGQGAQEGVASLPPCWFMGVSAVALSA